MAILLNSCVCALSCTKPCALDKSRGSIGPIYQDPRNAFNLSTVLTIYMIAAASG